MHIMVQIQIDAVKNRIDKSLRNFNHLCDHFHSQTVFFLKSYFFPVQQSSA